MKLGRRRGGPLVLASAATLVVGLGVAPAVAQVSSAGTASGQLRACGAAQLSLSVPASIKGDAIDGMGKLAWNILLRNTGSACSLAGWPALQVHSAGGKLVAIKTKDATDSNLAAVPARTVLLSHGQQAVVTVQGTDNTPGCAAGWALRVTLPGAAGALSAAQPAAAFGPCSGGELTLSPFYSRATLTKDIKALSVSASPSIYRTTNAKVPGACTAQRMRVAASYSSTGRYGTVEVLRLASRGSAPCVLPGEWPTVLLHPSTGASQIAKALPGLPRGVTGSSLISYRNAGGQQTDVTLRPGTSASVALIAQPKTAGACRVATSATIYPAVSDTGTGLTVALGKPLTFCGLPRELSFLAGRPATGSLMATAKELAQAQAGHVQPNGDSPSGFWYGTDSNEPVPTSSSGGVYQMPNSPTGGAYGGYVGEIGAYTNWQGCGSGLNWNATGYNDAQSNFTNHSDGVGAGVYWMMAGAGREPSYSSTNATTATNWGTSQATRAASDVSQPLSYPYVFMDIEDAVGHGWNAAWNGPCGGTETASSVPSAIDRDTFNGFFNYIDGKTPYLPAVYCAGGSGGSSWSGIFGSGQSLSNTVEWTYVNETGSLGTFPSSFSVGGTSASWFASAPANCQVEWQWSGGDGVLNGIGDFDQIDGNRTFICL